MKAIKILCSLIATGLFAACDDMSSVYQEYLDRGEDIYIGIADSLSVIPGNQRAVVKWKIDADPKLKDCVIKWGENDSTIFPIDRTVAEFTWMEGELKGLPEGSLVFTAYTRDIYGNRSLKSEKSQMIYGQQYIDAQSPRRIGSIDVYGPNDLTMTWNSMENCVGVNMHYRSQTNEMNDLFIKADQGEVKLTDFILGGEFSYETLYKPSDICLDTFATATKVANFPTMYLLDRSKWVATASSDAAGKDGETAQVLIDGKNDTYWHSAWGPDAPLPHWILLDLKKEYAIGEVQVYKREGNTDCKKLNIQVSIDGENFTEIGNVAFEKTQIPNGGGVVLGEFVFAKYIKCEITESWRTPYASLSEIKVFGKPIE